MNAASVQPGVHAVDAGQTIDAGAWSGYQKTLVLLTAVTIIFDGFDNQLLGLALPAVMNEWALPRAAFARTVAMGFVGMMIGGAIGGAAGDRVGRRSALLGSVLLFAAATMAISMAGSLNVLALLRLIAGAGLGAALPNAAALAAEYVPTRQRPMAVTLTIVCVPLGGTLAGLFAVPALPTLGWRGMFLIGGSVPFVVALVLTRLLPESPRFLAARPQRWPELARLLRRMGHPVAADATFVQSPEQKHARAPFRTLVERGFRRDTVALWGAFLSCLLAVYLGFSWLPSLLTSAGLAPAVASTGLTVFNLGGVVGAICGGLAIGRFGSKAPMIAMAAGAVAGAVVLSAMDIGSGASIAAIITMLAITGGLINAVQTTMFALAAHVYPTHVRATGVGTASAIGRTGAILSGYLGPWALDVGGSGSFFALMAATLTVTLVSLAIIRRHVVAR